MKPHLRLIHGIAANIFALIARAGYQLVQVPILFMFWDASHVGTWMLLSTIPSYLVLSTLGFGGAGANAITSAAIHDNLSEAQSIFKAIWLFVTFSNIAVSVGFYFGAEALLPYLRLSAVIHREIYTALVGLCVYVFFQVQFTGLELSFRFSGRYPIYLYLENLSTLAEPVVIYLVVRKYSSYGLLSLCLAASRFLFFVIGSILASPYSRVLWRGWQLSDIYRQFRKLLPASTGFVLAGLVMLTNVQGYVLVIGGTFGPAALATFVTMRILIRFFDTIINFVFNVLTVEASYIIPVGQIEVVTRLALLVTSLLFFSALLFSLFMLLFGQPIHKFWTHDKVHFNHGLLILLIAAILLRSLAAAPSSILTAANRNFSSNFNFLIASAVAIGGAYFTAVITGSLVATAAWSVVAEAGQLAIVFTLFARLVGTSPQALAARFANLGEQRRQVREAVTWVRKYFGKKIWPATATAPGSDT